ncbi:MAG: Vacuolar protein sorting-associated protein 20 [Chaenotheca gracillima]|nr:MAG: Vacuolar protein sorting-associated protein 20 [Chaenotheca gracillima]
MAQIESTAIVQAYRSLYREALRAVQYSKPGRYVVRDQIREGFRKGSREEFDASKIANTLEFLQGAAKERGQEHRILKNLVQTHFIRKRKTEAVVGSARDLEQLQTILQSRQRSYVAYERTLHMLNESMGLCLR